MKRVLEGGRGRGVATVAVAAAGGAVTLLYAVLTLSIQLDTTHGSDIVVPVLAGSLAVVLMAVGVVLLCRAVARGSGDR